MGEETGTVPGAPGDGAGDDVAALSAEVERLRADSAAAAARAAEAYAEAEALREEARAASEELAAAALEAERLQQELAAAAERESATAVRYREAVLRAEPALPPELLAGDSLEAIDRTAEAARAVVERVRERIAQDARVPAGAPPRRAPDTSGMTAEEKIRAGLSQRRG